MKRINALLIAHILLSTALLKAGDLPDAKTVLFLGDSITHSGQYIAFLETMLLAETDRRFQFLNLGLSSETVSGLSEDGHAGGKFPRPDLHERLDRVLAKTKPDLILACYGMNCGIYQPLDDGRFQKFKDGIQWLHDKAKTAAADIIHLTPPTYDTQQRKGEAPYYNSVLATYGLWLLSQRTNGWQVIDIHGPMDALLSEMRGRDPAAFLAKDGVHPGAEGHWLMAQQILRYWGVPSNQTVESFIAQIGTLHDLYELVSKRQRLLGASYLAEAGHKRPGVAPGLPLAEALRQAHELDPQIGAAAAIVRMAVVPSPFSGTRSTWNGYD
ncbi:MAG TPA: SGNH/GDSL hydrolase family protein [Verrucomicrobiae bacterium]|nr:SGNH/GDSL hydrolase family protein [Verrucomicrobiae bacterium]